MAEKHCESCGTELYDETELIEGDEYETCEVCKVSLICSNCQAEAKDNGGNPYVCCGCVHKAMREAEEAGDD